MDRLNPWIIGSAAAITFSILSTVCALAVGLFPDGTVGLFNAWFHGLDLTLLKPPGGRPLTLGQFFYGLFGVAVIHTLDAITSDRPYSTGLPLELARDEIRRQSDTQFDPRAVAVFVAKEATLRDMVELKYRGAALGRALTSNGQTEPPRGISKGER